MVRIRIDCMLHKRHLASPARHYKSFPLQRRRNLHRNPRQWLRTIVPHRDPRMDRRLRTHRNQVQVQVIRRKRQRTPYHITYHVRRIKTLFRDLLRIHLPDLLRVCLLHPGRRSILDLLPSSIRIHITMDIFRSPLEQYLPLRRRSLLHRITLHRSRNTLLSNQKSGCPISRL